MITRKLAIEVLDSYIANADERLKKFAARLAEEPAEAFVWSVDAFEAAARKEIFETYREALTFEGVKETDEEKVARLLVSAEQEMRCKLTPTRSTSFARNEIDRERGNAFRAVVELLENKGLF